jgi:hypothetical protein
MQAMNLPGFTAEVALHALRGHYHSDGNLGHSSAKPGVISQARAGGFGDVGGPFSGSCGCGPGYCCCIFCYFYSCYFWCWSNVRAFEY